MTSSDTLLTTALNKLHRSLGAKMVPFAGHDMPLQYDPGIVAEHTHTREKAGLFDVSHMGQALLIGEDEDPGTALERLTPGAIGALKPGRMRYSLLLNDAGGIRDDFMIARTGASDGRLYLVVNAATKPVDFALIQERLRGAARLEILEEQALLALQGPRAEAVLAELVPAVTEASFMDLLTAEWEEIPLQISRSGYTGEDGFEISLPAEHGEALARRLLEHDDVAPVGLGARDSLRLEAGMCLYGHDLTEETTPVEANLSWAIAKSRRERGDFPGAETILKQLEAGPQRLRVGLQPDGRSIAREGTEIYDSSGERRIGTVTSGSYGPSVGAPVAMGYVESGYAEPGTAVTFMLRGKPRPGAVAAMPFVPHRYKRKR